MICIKLREREPRKHLVTEMLIMRLRLSVVPIIVLVVPSLAHAGLYYSGETYNELPAQWRGLLGDLRALRNSAMKPGPNTVLSPMRENYEAEVKRLREAATKRQLTGDEQADLGALLIRLGDLEGALQVLRTAQRSHPRSFAIAANLGTAWQLYGDLDQAAESLHLAIDLAPEKLRKGEELQLRLVRLRQRQPRNVQELDNLFGVRYLGPTGKFEPGKMSEEQRKKLPPDAIAQVQQLALWLPADARLLWQLAELANGHGDIRIANELFESCVGQFGLSAPDLREHRVAVREAVAELAKQEKTGETARTEHAGHAGVFTPKSRRPLAVKRFDPATLPPISKERLNPLPWALLQETAVDRHFRPTFPRHLQSLHDHQVMLTGFMQPLTDELELNALMLIEYPTGCWFCEMPEVTGILLVELPEGKSLPYTRNLIKVTGKLSLNATDPENFLYTVKGARVVEAD